MSDEQKKEICKSYSYDMTLGEIANIEDITIEQVQEAVVWGSRNHVFDDLAQQADWINGKEENNEE